MRMKKSLEGPTHSGLFTPDPIDEPIQIVCAMMVSAVLGDFLGQVSSGFL